MTNTSNKDMSWLATQIRAALPEAKVDMYRPGPKGKGWIIDASHRDHLVVAMWTAASGFGVATPTEDDGYGTPPGEYYEQPEPALARVLHLLRSGEQAKTRREMQLQELRDHRSISQERLAKAMKVSQAHISQTERRTDVLLSSHRRRRLVTGGWRRRFPCRPWVPEVGGDPRWMKLGGTVTPVGNEVGVCLVPRARD